MLVPQDGQIKVDVLLDTIAQKSKITPEIQKDLVFMYKDYTLSPHVQNLEHKRYHIKQCGKMLLERSIKYCAENNHKVLLIQKMILDDLYLRIYAP